MWYIAPEIIAISDIIIIVILRPFYATEYMWLCSTKAVISNTGIFVAIDNNTLYGSKLYIFVLCQKSLGY